MRSAARSTCERHPIARARRLPLQPGERAYRWEVADRAVAPDVEVAECDDERSLAAIREDLLERTPRLDRAPGFRLAVVHRPQGDVLILALNHAMCDGMSAWRVIVSLCRFYAGEDDPVPPFDPLAARDVRPLVVPPSRRERLARLSRVPGVILRGARPVPIASQGSEGGGEAVWQLALDEGEVKALQGRRHGVATLNDVLVAGLVLAVRRWNREHGAKAGKVCVTVPVNLRPSSWAGEVLANLASFIPVVVRRSQTDDLDELIALVATSTERAKRNHLPQALFDVAPRLTAAIPLSRKLRMAAREPEPLERLQDTAVFSNLGRLTLPNLGEQAGQPRAVWGSTTARFTRGFTIVAMSLGGSLHLALRYHRELFDVEAVRAFGELYRGVLLDGLEGYSSTTSVSPSLTA
jgi:NRPS condensation-like uncharacterized protein